MHGFLLHCFFLSQYIFVMLFFCDTCDICLDLLSSCSSECNAISCFMFLVRVKKCVNMLIISSFISVSHIGTFVCTMTALIGLQRTTALLSVHLLTFHRPSFFVLLLLNNVSHSVRIHLVIQ